MALLTDHHEQQTDQTEEPALSSSRRRSGGQALVELAISIPVILLVVLGALDLGRAFTGWVVLNNAARVGANYAAANPDAWGSPGSAAQQGVYQQLVMNARADAGIVLAGCDAASIPDPSFPDGKDLSDYAVVDLACDFTPLTPIIGDVLAGAGNPIAVGAQSVFPIRTGSLVVEPPDGGTGCISTIGDVSIDDMTVTLTDATAGTPSSWVWMVEGFVVSTEQNPTHEFTVEDTHTVQLTATVDGVSCAPDQVDVTVPGDSSTGGPTLCTTPGLIGKQHWKAQGIWEDDGFSTDVQYADGADPTDKNWKIQSQDITAGQAVPCNSTIIIGPDPVSP